MPADAGVDDRGPCGLYRLGKLHDLFKGRAVGDQVDHRQTVDEDEIGADGLAHAAHDLDWQPHAVLVRPAPFVGPFVGVGDEELVQEVPFGAHHLYPVIACLFGTQGAGGDIADLLFDAFRVQFFRGEHRDGGFDRRGGDAIGAEGIAPRVQDLHRDLAACLVHAVGDDAVVVHVLLRQHHRGTMGDRPFGVRPDATCHHQPHIATRAGGVEFGDAVPVLCFLEPGVHRPHQHAVLQRREPQIKRGKQVRIVGHLANLSRAECRVLDRSVRQFTPSLRFCHAQRCVSQYTWTRDSC